MNLANKKMIDAMMAGVGTVMEEYVEQQLAPLQKRIEALEARDPIPWKGVHQEGREYEPGQFVTFQGGLWHCHRKTTQRPNESPDWQLAIKRGRDSSDRYQRHKEGK